MDDAFKLRQRLGSPVSYEKFSTFSRFIAVPFYRRVEEGSFLIFFFFLTVPQATQGVVLGGDVCENVIGSC